jgi:restriction system protein
MVAAVATGLRPAGWLLLTAGAVLLVFKHLQKVMADAEARVNPPSTKTTWPAPPSGKGASRPSSPPTFVSSPAQPATPLTQWSPAVFQAIEWRRFEAVCEALFAQAGFETRSQSHGPDGGVDVWLHSKNAVGPVSVAQCKHWKSKPVGVKEVREFFGVMASHQLKRGTYATTSNFTADAIAFGKSNGINLLDGAGLLRQITQRTPEQQQALLAVAFEGDYARPTCASCGTKMVERAPAKGGSAFWGCMNYPRCRTRLAMAR